MTPLTAQSELADLVAKVHAGERLTEEDGVRLFHSRDIHTIGELADHVRRRLHGRAAYYNINRHINYSNVCVLRCRFCSFYRPYPKSGEVATLEAEARPVFSSDGALPILGQPTTQSSPAERSAGCGCDDGGGDAPALGEDDTYQLSIEEIVRRAREAADAGATEVHIVGGLHPRLPFAYYLDMCRGIKDACPQLHIKAFTAIEIIHFTRITKPRLSIREVLDQLRDAGLGSLPGGGAEIFDDRVHDEAYKNKVGEQGWFDVHRVAHDMGIFSNATMLYGHIESFEERVRHLIKLREHQDASLAERQAQFNCLIPLSFIPDNSELAHLEGPSGLDDLKTLAISRLLCDNIPHIKAFWIMQTPKLAQMSLSWGVDDLDGTVVWYDITKREGGGGTTHQEMTGERLVRLIAEAGFEPIERDTLYQPVQRQS